VCYRQPFRCCTVGLIRFFLNQAPHQNDLSIHMVYTSFLKLQYSAHHCCIKISHLCSAPAPAGGLPHKKSWPRSAGLWPGFFLFFLIFPKTLFGPLHARLWRRYWLCWLINACGVIPVNSWHFINTSICSCSGWVKAARIQESSDEWHVH